MLITGVALNPQNMHVDAGGNSVDRIDNLLSSLCILDEDGVLLEDRVESLDRGVCTINDCLDGDLKGLAISCRFTAEDSC